MEKKEKEYIGVSILVAILFILPQLIAMVSAENYNYFYTDAMVSDDFLYAARLNAVIHGNYSPDIVNLEHREDIYPTEKIEQSIFLVIHSILGNFFASYLLLLALAGFFSSYLCLKVLGLFFKDNKSCILIMLLTLSSVWFYYAPPWSITSFEDMLNSVFINPEHYLGNSLGQSKMVPYSMFFSARLYYQMFGYPLLFLAIYLLVEGFGKKNPEWILGAAVIAGLFSYIYFYFAIIGALLLGMFFLYSAYLRDIEKMKYGGAALVVAFLISLPYLLTMVGFIQGENYSDIEERLGTQYGNFFMSDLLAVKLLVIGALLFAFGNKREKGFSLILFAIPLAALSHVVTGKILQVEHFYAIGTPFAFMASLLLLKKVYELWGKGKSNIPCSDVKVYCIFLILLVYLLIQINVGHQLPGGETAESYAAKDELFSYIKSEITMEEVILTPATQLNVEISANTARPLFMPDSYLTSASTTELSKRMLLGHKLCGTSAGELEKLLKGEDPGWYFYTYHMKYEYNPKYGKTEYYDSEDKGKPYPVRRVPLEIRKEMLLEYSLLDTESILKQGEYQVDYLIIEKDNGEWACDYLGGKEVFSNNKYVVLELEQD